MEDLLSWLMFGGMLAGLGLLFWLFGRWMDRRDEAETQAAMQVANASRRAEWEQEDKEHREFRERAVRMRAKVLSKLQGGRVNLRPNLHIRLMVEAPGGAYEVEVEERLDYEHPGRFREGSMVDVLVDPEDREHVVLC
jgi:hypothetical protein